MELTKNLESLSILALIERFEADIRFGCHSTLAEANRSQAGKELLRRAKRDEIIRSLHGRWKEMNAQSLDEVEESVRNGIAMLIQWIEQQQEEK